MSEAEAAAGGDDEQEEEMEHVPSHCWIRAGGVDHSEHIQGVRRSGAPGSLEVDLCRDAGGDRLRRSWIGALHLGRRILLKKKVRFFP